MICKEHFNFKLYKPFGMLSQFSSNDPKENRKASFISELGDFPEGTMPVGRLDKKSEGLLLLTTDGKLSDFINRSGIEKEYYAQLDGLITDEALYKICSGVEIGFAGKRYITKPCKAKKIEKPNFLTNPDASLRIDRHRPTIWISITVTEGKFKQIRKMTAAVGYPTLRLVRMRIGKIMLNNLSVGNWEPLNSLP